MLRKTKEQIINDYENRAAMKFVAGAVMFAGFVLAFILSGSSGRAVGAAVMLVCALTAVVLSLIAYHCPICDSMNVPQVYESGIFYVETGFFRCDTCNLSTKQVREYVDLLKRGVEIDKNVIARFNKRDL